MKNTFSFLFAVLMLLSACGCSASPEPTPESSPSPLERAAMFDTERKIHTEVYDSKLERIYGVRAALELEDGILAALGTELFGTLTTQPYPLDELAARRDWAEPAGTVELRLEQQGHTLNYIWDCFGMYVELNGRACRVSPDSTMESELLDAVLDCLPVAELGYIEYLHTGSVDASETDNLTDQWLTSPYRLMGGGADESVGTFVISASGNLYGRGSNHFSELFFGEDGNFDWTHIASGVKKIGGSDTCRYMLKSNGDLCTLGGMDACAFCSPSRTWSYRPVIARNVIDFAANGRECYVIKHDGTLWGWTEQRELPVKILENVKAVYSVGDCFAAVTYEDDAYIWSRWDGAAFAPEPAWVSSGISAVSGVLIEHGGEPSGEIYDSFCQLLTMDGRLLRLDTQRFRDSGTLPLGEPELLDSDVRELCPSGYVKNDGSFRAWNWGDNGPEAVTLAENIVAANATAYSAIAINEVGKLLVFESGKAVHHWDMDIFE